MPVMRPIFCSILACFSSCCVYAAGQPDIYAPQLFTGGGYGQSNNSYGGGGAWVPLYQNPGNVVFTQFSMPEYRKQTGFYESVALGVRHLVPDRSLWGVHAGITSIQGQTHNYDFYRAIAGLQIQLPHWLFNFTTYVPFGDSDYDKGLNDSSEQLVADPDNANFKNILVNQEADPIRILPGGMVELGWRVPHSRGLMVYGGFYEFFGRGGFQNYYGPELRLQYHLDTLIGWHPGWLHHINLNASWSDDNANRSIYTVGIGIDIPVFGDKQYHHLTALQQAMQAPVYMPTIDRSIHDNRSFRQTFDMTDGRRTTVQEVSTKATLESAVSASDHANWVLLTNTNPIDMGDTTLDLATGVKLTGNGITLDDGQTFFANGVGNNRGISGSWSGTGFGNDPAVQIADGGNNTIQYLTINNATTSDYDAIRNSYSGGGTGLGVGTVNINHINADGQVDFTIADGSTGSNITFNNNTLNLRSSNGFGNGFRVFTSASGTTAKVSGANNNTITVSGSTAADMAFIAFSGSTINVTGSISGNTLTGDSGVGNTGLRFTNSASTMTVTGDVSNNTITTDGFGTPIFINTISGGTSTFGDFTNNTATGTGSSNGVVTITTNTNGSSITFGAWSGNDFTDTNSSGGAAFRVNSANTTSVTFSGAISNNTFTSAGGAGLSNSITGDGTISYESGLNANTFIYDADGGQFGINNSAGSGTICASNNSSVTSDNTFSPSAGSGNQIDNAFSSC